MNVNAFSNALGELDDRYISEAIGYTAKKKHGWVKWGALAACLAVVVAVGVGYRARPANSDLEGIGTPIDIGQGEITAIPRWEDLAICEQYFDIPLNDEEYNARKGVIPLERLGPELAAVTARGVDEYAFIAGENPDRYLGAAVYEITGVSPECAVAVRYEGSDTYYAAVNWNYRPETLGQFIEDLDLRNTLVVNAAYYDDWEYVDDGLSTAVRYAVIQYDGIDREKVWALLLSNTAAFNEYDELNFDQPGRILGLSIDIPLLGYTNISISVHEGGYIMTNILDTGKMFHVGETNTKAFVDYVLKECEGHEVVWTTGVGEPIPE